MDLEKERFRPREQQMQRSWGTLRVRGMVRSHMLEEEQREWGDEGSEGRRDPNM